MRLNILNFCFIGLLWVLPLFFPSPVFATSDSSCFACGKAFNNETIYTGTDAVTGEKVFVCARCAKTPNCYICGVPMGPNGMTLPDGRHLCPRDAKGVVLDAGEIVNACSRAKDEADRQFVRFMTFPENISTLVIDRLDVQSMFVVDGHDIECPDILGWCRPVTNGVQKTYLIGLMSGLPPGELRATSVHELGHTWVGQNVSVERRAELMRSTEEGFCELLAYLTAEKHADERQKKIILKNLYTRGQVQLFIDAERRYGLNDILDWMKFGEGTNLVAGHADDIHRLKPLVISPPASVSAASSGAGRATNSPAIVRPVLRLDGVLWAGSPVAIINGKSFRTGDENSVMLGSQKILIRCLGIEKNSARILRNDSGAEIILRLAD